MNKMNQSQTRSPRKRLLSLILAVILMIGLLPISAFATSASAQANDAEDTGYKYNIMFLDCGRKYYSVDSIKKIIDNASAAGFNYIQLAVGNDGLRFLLKDMSLEVGDKTYTSDAVTAAIETGNKQYSDSKGTTNSALSETDMDTIIAYAASKGMGVIPCVNTPGHMDAILSAATSLTGETCSYRGSARTIDVTNTTAVAFTQALLQKYISYFAGKGCKLFNMGADEYANDKFTGGSMGFGNLQDTGNYRYYVDYVNAVAKMIKTAGMTPMAFNDGIYFNSNTSSGTFDTDILICYWSNGWSSYAPMPAANLAAKGFKLINTNGDYYWVLGGTQCSADKAKEFDYKSFPAKQGDNGTIDNPSGSMFCIWCDYPDAETEDSVISKTAATIAAFGKTLPKVKTQTNIKSSIGSTTLSVNGSTELSISDGSSATWTVSPAGVIELTANTNAADGSVVGSSVIARAIAKGTATVTATTADGKTYTMELTVENPNEKDITVVVGGKETVSVSGNHEGIYNTENPSVATVATKHTASTEMTVSTVNATEIESGSQYLIALDRGYDNTSSRKILYNEKNEKSGNGLKLSDYDTNQLWTITGTKNSNNSYTANVKGVNGTSIMSIGDGTATLGADGSVTLNYNTGGYWEIYSTGNWTTYYLNQYGGSNSSMAAGYSDSPSYDVGSRWRLFKVTPAATEQTTITFTGVSVGDTSVTIGDVKYNIHVLPEDLAKVTPLKLEYWITNAPVSTVSGCETEPRTNTKSETYTAYYKPIKATDNGVATAEGIDVTTLAPDKTGHEKRTIYYWRCRMLDTTLYNSSTSDTERQTNDSGDDETVNGVGFTKIRYYGGQWQVFTDAGQWVKAGNENQLVAYYREYIRVTDEVETYAADWGKRGDGTTTGDYLSPSAVNTISYQVVYEDGITNPTGTTAADLRSKTMCYGNWSPNRGVGTIMLQDTSNYEIYKVTAETGSMTGNSSTGGNYGSYTVTNLEWDGNEVAVWNEDTDSRETNGEIVIHNNAKNPTTEGFYGNLTWDENYESILIRVYVRAKVTEDSLTVNYYDRTDGTDKMFYSYNIAVEKGTFFDQNFAYVPGETGKSGSLKNNTVVNINKVTQTVQWDLSKMTQIGAQYRYSDYVFVAANRSEDSKTVNLYYTFSASKTFVVDFGLPLVIKPVDVNTNLGNKGVTITKVSIGATSTYANITVDDQNYITYALKNKTTIDGKDTLSLQYSGQIPVTHEDGTESVQEGEVKYTLTIIPASNVYYEDSLASFADGKGVAENAKWSTVNNDGNKNATEKTDVYQALQELGSKDVYGYDGAYNKDNSSMLSMGTAHKVTVTSAMADTNAWKEQPNSAWPTASFTFTGTGFDIISLTNNKSGAIFVDVYAGGEATGEPVKTLVVNNYYGYTNENGQWVVKENASDTLYQIPVLKVDGLDHGEYTAVITVIYNSFFDKTTERQYSFWLDAIRVYNPMGDCAEYTKDNEGYPQYIKLHDELVKTDKGVVFIDGAEEATIGQYANYGPNNEVYLAQGQAISFKLTGNTNEIASIQIGAKAPNGAATMVVEGKVSTTTRLEQQLNTATEMYYNITEQAKDGQLVTISNTGNGILSLTNLKITYKDKAHEEVKLESLTAEEQTNAVAMVQALFAAPVETFSPETFQADWGRAVRAGKRATLTVKTSADVESITVDGVTVTSYTTRTERTGWGWWSPKVTYHVFTYTTTAPAQTTDYAVCAVNAEGTASEPITATLTVRPATWWNWWF